MLDAVIDALVQSLQKMQVNAVRCFPEAQADYCADIVCLKVRSCRSLSAGFADYVGTRERADGGQTEIYAKRIELEVSLEAYSPTARGCTQLADRVSSLLSALPEGLRALELERGELVFKRAQGAFCCGLVLKCTALFLAESAGEDEEFLDFVLKGSVGNAD